LNKKYLWYAAGFFAGWALLNVILAIMKKDKYTLFMITLPGLVACIGWVYAEYRLVWRD